MSIALVCADQSDMEGYTKTKNAPYKEPPKAYVPKTEAPVSYKAPVKKYVPKTKAPVKYKPAPTKYKPAPTKYKPAPTKYKPTPAPYKPTPAPSKPAPFSAPAVAYPGKPAYKCSKTCKPNSAKYMSYVCASLHADAIRWGKETCKPYNLYKNAKDKSSQYQAKLCTYWTQKSIMNVVTSCFMEAHLRNIFVMKYGREGPGVWYCRYLEFMKQVKTCYSKSAKYYPLGESMNKLETTVASLYKPNKKTMPPFTFKGASLAMCAYYNKDQVYHGKGY